MGVSNEERDREYALRITTQCIPVGGDPENAHYLADAILCSLLTDLGMTETVAAWREVKKWYA